MLYHQVSTKATKLSKNKKNQKVDEKDVSKAITSERSIKSKEGSV